VYARGGPTNVDPPKDLSALLDRSPADVRGIKCGPPASQNEPPAGAPAPRPPALVTAGSLSAGGSFASPGAVTGLQARPARMPALPPTPHDTPRPAGRCKCAVPGSLSFQRSQRGRAGWRSQGQGMPGGQHPRLTRPRRQGTPSPGLGSARSAAGAAAARATFKDKPAAVLSPAEGRDNKIHVRLAARPLRLPAMSAWLEPGGLVWAVAGAWWGLWRGLVRPMLGAGQAGSSSTKRARARCSWDPASACGCG